jgi:ferredoxin
MKAKVDQTTCVGCGLCAETCPNVFEMAGGLAQAKGEGVVSAQDAAACRKAADECPVEAISLEG